MSRSRALLAVSIAYLVTFVLGGLAAYLLARSGEDSLIAQMAVADLVGTAVIFGFSLRYDNSSLYDAYWSVIPMGLAAYLVHAGWGSGANLARALIMAALVWYWGARLTHNWARGWPGMEHEDWRYVNFRNSCGRLYWLVSLLGIHLFPTIVVFLGCVPMFMVMTEPGAALGWLDLVAALVTFGAVSLELVADNQLRDYVRHRKRPGETMTEGVWGWSRHPNYFGEMGFWAGLYLFGVAAVGFEPWWMAAGVVVISSMFVFISIPLIEKRMLARRHDYADIQRRISMLVPLPPRGARSESA